MIVPVIASGVFLAIARYILTGLGVGIVTYVGFEALLAQLGQLIIGNASSIGGAAAGVAGLMGVPAAASMIVSAYTVRLSLATLKRFRLL